MRKLILLAMMVVGCGSNDDSKPAEVPAEIDWTQADVLLISVETVDLGKAFVNLEYNAFYREHELGHSGKGWFSMVAYSTEAMPGSCADGVSLGGIDSIELSNLGNNMVYLRACLARDDGYISKGITKIFQSNDYY